MLDNIKNEIDIVAGTFPDDKSEFLPLFDKNVLHFLEYISSKIFKNTESKKYPDLIDFGFWCRKKNIIKISSKMNIDFRIPRGIALHITPSNVAMNSAFSLALGLLSGCKNIVRMPSKKFSQLEELIKIINNVLKIKKFSKLKNYICLIRYEKSESISKNLSQIVDTRLIWGGDDTAKLFKSFPTKLKCKDLIFPNKYSATILNFKKIDKLNKMNLDNLIKKFYVDTYTMDQLGCSSPKIIFLLNYSKKHNYFWKKLEDYVTQNYEYNFSVTNKKIYNFNLLSIDNKFNFQKKNFKLNFIKLKNKNKLNNDHLDKLSYGTFLQIKINKIEEIKKYLNYNFQTLTYFGLSQIEIKKNFLNIKFKNIDRIVSVGQAFNMSIIWDGYNILEEMSKTLEIN